MYTPDEQLRNFIADSGLVSPSELSEIEKKAKEEDTDLGKMLIKSGKLTEDTLRKTQSYILGIPFISLDKEKINFDVLSLIPEPIARKHNIVAYKKSSEGLEVAMLDVEDLTAIDFVKKKVGLKILPRLTDSESMKQVLAQYRKTLKAEFDEIIGGEAKVLQKVMEGDIGDTSSEADLKKLAENLPIVKIVDTLLQHAILGGASDIHIEPEENQVLIRYRIDGILHDAMTLPKNTAPGIIARIKVLSNLKLDEKRLPQDGRFKIELSGEPVSFRVSTLPTYYGEKTVMRILRESAQGFTLEGLGFHGDGLEQIYKATKQTTGMILATGPTGSGKTTTLYTLVDILNGPEVNISTIEDPIEYQMQRVNQTQVRSEIGLSFANGLRTLLRQDPDIIMVGEIRDTETAALAVNAALTGHLVFSTLHTNSAAGAIPRLIDMGIEPFLLVSTLKVVTGQRLIRRVAAEKEKTILTKDELHELGKIVDLDRMLMFLKKEKVIHDNDDWSKVSFYKPKKQGNDGYSGRVGIHEVFYVSDAIRALIIKGATSQEIEDVAKKEGMLTMLEDGILLAAQGITTIEEVLRVVSE